MPGRCAPLPIPALAAAFAALAPGLAHAQPIQALPTLPGQTYSTAFGVSADGRVAFGVSTLVNGIGQPIGQTTMIWTEAGAESLGTLGGPISTPGGVSWSGDVVVGDSDIDNNSNRRAFRWTRAGGMQNLGVLPGSPPAFTAATAVSGDGAVVVGFEDVNGSTPWRWTLSGGVQPIGQLWRAMLISGDGQTIFGRGLFLPEVAYRWTAPTGNVSIPPPAPWSSIRILAVSDDAQTLLAQVSDGVQSGGVIVRGGVARTLANPPGTTWAYIRGWWIPGGLVFGQAVGPAGMVLTPAGVVPAAQYLASRGVDTAGWQMIEVRSASADGRTLVGNGVSPQGRNSGWTVHLSAPSPCYANCDGSTAAPTLNVNDFLCFQAMFSAGDPYANCDGSTLPPILNVSDFLCFQSRFAAGCP